MLNEHRLKSLRKRLDVVNQTWTTDHYRSLIDFYVRILPSIMDCERCGIFVLDRETQQIESTAGTGLDEHTIVAPGKESIVGQVIATGEPKVKNTLDVDGFHAEIGRTTGFVSRNILCVAIRSMADNSIMGAVEVLNKDNNTDFTPQDLELLNEVARYLAMAMENIILSKEILTISNSLNREVADLRGEAAKSFIATSPPMQHVVEQVRTVGHLPVSVMIYGENGTGKEQVARMIHDSSDRASRGFIAVNCAAIPEMLVESEFFGYEKGAFTGAGSSRPGRFEDASGGTLFLDEIGEMPVVMQPKFLRVLQESEGMRLGSNQLRKYDFRVICATNKDLREEVRAGRFREDLYYRLFSVEITLPPVREREGDIMILAQTFLEETRKKFKKETGGFDDEVLALFEAYHWPGNVRQLRREIERLVALTPEGQPLSSQYLTTEVAKALVTGNINKSRFGSLPEEVETLERAMITKALTDTNGNKAAASRILGITRQGLHKKLARYKMNV